MIGRGRRDRIFHNQRPDGGDKFRLFMTLCFIVAAATSGCVPSPAPPMTGTFDGTWTSAQIGYDLHVMGPLGTAVRARAAGVQDGDPVFRMTSMEGMHFNARQWLTDGAWHTVFGELRQDGKLSCTDGSTSWVLERR